jgi:uncharacterized coiled-coil protein SlyX
MNFKLPQKGSIVISIGGGESSDKKNTATEKRLDSLEKQLSSQYKRVQDNKPNDKAIQQLEKTFASRIDKLISSNNSMITKLEKSRLKDLKSVFADYFDNDNTNDNGDLIKVFSKKLGSLESAIKSIPRQETKVIRSNGMPKQFESMVERLEKAIMKARPRAQISPM